MGIITENKDEILYSIIEILPALAYMDEKYRYQIVPNHKTKDKMIYIKKGSSGNKSISTKNIKVLKTGSEEEMKNHLSKIKDKSIKKEETESEITERCWKGYTQKGMKTMFGKRYPNCVKKTK
jgi:isopropylmalate/homocitrate/citramalate synthase